MRSAAKLFVVESDDGLDEDKRKKRTSSTATYARLACRWRRQGLRLKSIASAPINNQRTKVELGDTLDYIDLKSRKA